MNARVQVSEQWATRLVEFNVHVARTAHPSWIPRNVRPFVFDVSGAVRPRAERALSEWLREAHGLENKVDWQMEEPEKRIWLLDPPSLTRLTRELSIVMHRDWLVCEIDGARLREVRGRIDPVLWRLMVEEMPVNAAHHESARVSFLNREPRELESDLLADGARTLIGLLAPEWEAVRGRAKLRFDAALFGEGLQREARLPAARVLGATCAPEGEDSEADAASAADGAQLGEEIAGASPNRNGRVSELPAGSQPDRNSCVTRLAAGFRPDRSGCVTRLAEGSRPDRLGRVSELPAGSRPDRDGCVLGLARFQPDRLGGVMELAARSQPDRHKCVMELVRGWLVPRRLPQWAWLF
jgi:hypothetical protein